MKLAWYPWQLFIRKKEVVIPVVITFVIALVLSVWLELKLQRVPQPVFLHYSIELGVDALGNMYTALLLPGALLLALVINTIIANILMLSARTVALVLLWNTIPLSLLAFWFGMLILRVNGA